MRIVLIGGTGLIGRLLLPHLLEAGHEVHALQRREARFRHPDLDLHIAPAEDWPRLTRELAPEAAISALGTTMRQAGSPEGFRAVDFDMVLAFAAAAREAGATRMLTVSSVGASGGSRNFYLAIKGEMENALEALAFERLDIFRPGLLRGERGADRRLGERLGILLSPLVNLALKGPLSRYAAIDASTVAAAMAAAIAQAPPGVHVYENRAISRLARG